VENPLESCASEAAVEALATFLKLAYRGFPGHSRGNKGPNVKPMILRLRLKKTALGGKAEMTASWLENGAIELTATCGTHKRCCAT